MSYYFAKEVEGDFESTKAIVTEKLKEFGFGVLTEIDIQATLKKKIDADFHKYTVLGACNPKMAYQALQAEEHIGLMLPCNVVVQQKSESSKVEVSAINPVASMIAIKSDGLGDVAGQVESMLKNFIDSL